MKSALIINNEKEEAQHFAVETIEFLQANKHAVVMLEKEAEAVKKSELAAPREQLADSDLIIVLGGDGTILRAIREVNYTKTPFIGVNLGRLGFLATVRPEELVYSIERFVKNEFITKRKRMLEWKIKQDDKVLLAGMALNDIAISRFGNRRIIRCEVFINDKYFSTYPSDGIVFASPTGSTAYSFSAGGPVVSPDCEAYIMTPISAHSLFNRSVILAPDDIVKIKVDKEAFVLCDGQDIIGEKFNSLNIGLSDKYINFVDFEENGFYGALKKLAIPDEPF